MMPEHRSLITGGDVVTAAGLQRVDVLIAGEQIAAILDPSAGEEIDAERIDASGHVVLPGLIDAHMHFIQDDPESVPPDPDAFEYEGFTAGGRGAAAGGVTTVVEMPQSAPPTRDGTTFARKRELAERDAVVDFALWGGILPDQSQADLDEQLAAGAAGFKAFMCDFDPMFRGIDDARLLDAMRGLRGTAPMLGLHAENDALLHHLEDRMRSAGRRDPMAHAESRPPIVEIEAVSRAIVLAESEGAWVHIVHLSTAEAAALVKDARNRGVRVTCETCPQYLALDLDDLERLAGFARCAPAIRSREEVEALWEFVIDGTIDCITSDHCGYTVESKQRGQEDIFLAPNGLAGVQTVGPVFWSEARRRGMEWEKIADLLASAPARLWGLAPRKGSITPGADADFVFVDPAQEWVVDVSQILHTHKWTPFEGRQLSGKVARTILRGRTVHLDGTPVAAELKPGTGRFLRAWE